MPNIDLTQILQAVIGLIAALVTYKLIPWISARTTQTQRANLAAAARVAVFAAEQLYGAGGGEDKLAYALTKLRNKGFDLDADTLREAVEAAVYAMSHADAVTVDETVELTDGNGGEK